MSISAVAWAGALAASWIAWGHDDTTTGAAAVALLATGFGCGAAAMRQAARRVQQQSVNTGWWSFFIDFIGGMVGSILPVVGVAVAIGFLRHRGDRPRAYLVESVTESYRCRVVYGPVTHLLGRYYLACAAITHAAAIALLLR